MKDHERAQLVNDLRDIAVKYHGHGCLRELIAQRVNKAIPREPEKRATPR